MLRSSALILVAALASVGAVAPVSHASAAAGDVSASLTIIDADTFDYPGAPNTITVCLDGSPVSSDLTAGEQVGPLDITTADVTVDVFEAPQAGCDGTPTYTVPVTLADGDDVGLVLTVEAGFTFPYETQCPSDGTAWLMAVEAADLRESASVGVYFIDSASTNDDDLFPIIDELEPLTSSKTALPTGTYDFLFFATGADPFTATPLGEVKDVAMGPGTSTQLFLAGVDDGLSGAFATQRATEPCESEPETTTSTSTSTTTAVATSPATAAPATPVSGTATFTG